jgi:hypothetical protein
LAACARFCLEGGKKKEWKAVSLNEGEKKEEQKGKEKNALNPVFPKPCFFCSFTCSFFFFFSLSHLDPLRRPPVVVIELGPGAQHLGQSILRVCREKRGQGTGGEREIFFFRSCLGVRGRHAPPKPLDRSLGFLLPPLSELLVVAAAAAAQAPQPLEQGLRVPVARGLERGGEQSRRGGADWFGRRSAGGGGPGVLRFFFFDFRFFSIFVLREL